MVDSCGQRERLGLPLLEAAGQAEQLGSRAVRGPEIFGFPTSVVPCSPTIMSVSRLGLR